LKWLFWRLAGTTHRYDVASILVASVSRILTVLTILFSFNAVAFYLSIAGMYFMGMIQEVSLLRVLILAADMLAKEGL
jgi:hypothetical protein